MKSEHCDKTGAHDKFTTPNYHIETTPAREWAIVVNGGHGDGHGVGDGDQTRPSESEMRHGRVIRSVDSMMANQLAIDAKLTRPEVIALELYTGPMVS